jgi:hypothetical protein
VYVRLQVYGFLNSLFKADSHVNQFGFTTASISPILADLMRFQSKRGYQMVFKQLGSKADDNYYFLVR